MHPPQLAVHPQPGLIEVRHRRRRDPATHQLQEVG